MISFIQQYPVCIPFIALLSAEVVKMSIDLIKRRSKIRFLKTGGMPSGHSSLVSSVVVIAAYKEGLDSVFFVISAVVALESRPPLRYAAT